MISYSDHYKNFFRFNYSCNHFVINTVKLIKFEKMNLLLC